MDYYATVLILSAVCFPTHARWGMNCSSSPGGHWWILTKTWYWPLHMARLGMVGIMAACISFNSLSLFLFFLWRGISTLETSYQSCSQQCIPQRQWYTLPMPCCLLSKTVFLTGCDMRLILKYHFLGFTFCPVLTEISVFFFLPPTPLFP